jgi:5'-3' exonuclease
VATDHVVESFRNDLYDGYKTGAGIEPTLLEQFPLLEESLMAMGVYVWPMVELEADDALASAAAVAADDDRVEQIAILTPDKDLAQCVRGGRIVQVDRRNDIVYDDEAVAAKFGVPPALIIDYLALVGDSADGYPGLKGWGAKSTAAILRAHGPIESIPDDMDLWKVKVRGAASLAATLASEREDAMLFKTLATLRVDRSLLGSVDQLKWDRPTEAFEGVCAVLESKALLERAQKCAVQRA